MDGCASSGRASASCVAVVVVVVEDRGGGSEGGRNRRSKTNGRKRSKVTLSHTPEACYVTAEDRSHARNEKYSFDVGFESAAVLFSAAFRARRAPLFFVLVLHAPAQTSRRTSRRPRPSEEEITSGALRGKTVCVRSHGDIVGQKLVGLCFSLDCIPSHLPLCPILADRLGCC